jgi:hypothetical protein
MERVGSTARPLGRITRGTTGTNRLRRMDRWIAALPALRRSPDPLVVDLGYGAAATTVLELAGRLARVRPGVAVVGIEIDPERVAAAEAALRVAAATRDAPTPAVSFRRGGFEVPLPGDRRPAIIRAANVLRQYDEAEVPAAWATMLARLQPGGALVEGTCSETGRVGAWVTASPERGPESLTLALRLASLGTAAAPTPAIVATRLPKALIHRNVPGEPIHAFLTDLDRAWAATAALSPYGPVQRWLATAAALRTDWPIQGGRTRWRLGELTVAWPAIAPAPPRD